MLEYREALELFRYDYETGVLYWRWRVSNRVPKTLEAGTQRKSSGYLYVQVHGRLYPVHRVVMLMCYGFYGEGLDVDHINHVRNDNRLFNLRFVTRSENSKNQSLSSKSTTGVTGGVFLESQEKVYSPNRGKPETYIPWNVRDIRRSRRRTGGSQFKI